MICPPSVLEVFHYAFCYIGILTGKYFKNFDKDFKMSRLLKYS